MKTLVSTLICIIFLMPWYNLSAQDEQSCIIQGTIKDSLTKETLVGVNVYIKDNQKGTITDSKGFFRLKLNKGDYTIVISYVGYKQKELAIKANKDYSLEIFLSQDITNLEEVKITGQRRFFGNMDYG
jgi:hypothetical protein